jgi:adenosylcobinamide amidohydrolase
VPDEGFVVSCAPPFLTARFSGPRRTLSWSLTHPGFASAREVVWLEVRNADLAGGVDPVALLRSGLAEIGLPEALGFMTSRDIRNYHLRRRVADDVTGDCLTTVGLSNGERVGARRRARLHFGTINTLVHVSHRLTDGALVEAVAIAAQARTAAILEAKPRCVEPGITGTGTDCIVVCCPETGEAEPWSGLHTAVGEAIGGAVYEATREGVEVWDRETCGGYVA